MCTSNPKTCACGCQSNKSGRQPTPLVTGPPPLEPPPLVHSPLVYNVLDSPGQPLPSPLKGWLEQQFRTNLDHVRIHVDERAFEAAWEIHALAFTWSNHIVFGEAHFAPQTWSGMRLLGHELAHVLQQTRAADPATWPGTSDVRDLELQAEDAGHRLRLGTLRLQDGFRPRSAATQLQLLGTSPDCSQGQREMIHQSIFNANSWVLKAIRQVEERPLSSTVLSSLRRNFGSSYGVAANAELIAGRLRRARNEMLRMPIGCNSTDPICTGGSCGFSVPGSLSATICSNVTLVAGVTAVYRAGCVLHESFHATFSRFTIDEYSGWHGNSGNTATYPGTGTDPLLNADSYTTLCMDLS